MSTSEKYHPPLRILTRSGDFFILGLMPHNAEDANSPPGLEVSFKNSGAPGSWRGEAGLLGLDAFLDALPYGPRGSGATKQEAAQALLDQLKNAVAHPAALMALLSEAANREAEEVDTAEDQLAQSELWEASKVWALASGIVSAASKVDGATSDPDDLITLLRLAAAVPEQPWAREQAADIDGDLPAAELDEAQLRGVVGVELLRLRRDLEVARAESEANNARTGEVVAERAALRREIVGQTDRVKELEAKLMITKQRASVLEDLARAYGAPIPK